MNLMKWLYRGGRPIEWQALSTDARLRSTPLESPRNYLVALNVRGRRSGRMISLPLVMAVVGGERYLVSMLGANVDWVLNVKAADGSVILRHGRREEVRLEEAPGESACPRAEGLLETGAWREATSAHSQRCTAFRVRAGRFTVPGIPGCTKMTG